MNDENRHQEIVAAVEEAIGRLDEREREEQARQRTATQRKERLTSRVSIAAIALTLLLSFISFARGERDSVQKKLRDDASSERRDMEANWSLYQTKVTERSDYVTAEDALTREVADLGAEDARLRLAELNHVEYASRITALDNQNRQVFFIIQDLQRRSIQARRQADHIGAKIANYDMGTRVLTLALVVLSVTLLANRERLFWAAVAIAFAGAGIAVAGYFV